MYIRKQLGRYLLAGASPVLTDPEWLRCFPPFHFTEVVQFVPWHTSAGDLPIPRMEDPPRRTRNINFADAMDFINAFQLTTPGVSENHPSFSVLAFLATQPAVFYPDPALLTASHYTDELVISAGPRLTVRRIYIAYLSHFLMHFFLSTDLHPMSAVWQSQY